MTEQQAKNAWRVLVELWIKENGEKPVKIEIHKVGGEKSA